ncbi:hypothetical protein BDM02DRAFT_3106705 [Thelephora ganbajun]|uniref:Uncharacterized protein n=1 Tax=Thelephora ganbajun TaxID=370292 RepID=A0ACB6ZXN4_THEGA|nr:hypothetical protein BDM02DRAFT_3106705 [Thelephora ganbajun]
MKKRWEGGWDECKKLKELEARPFRPLVHPLAHYPPVSSSVTKKYPIPPQHNSPL